MKFHFFRGKNRIGLDITPDRMSLISLRKRGKRYHIDHAMSVSFKPLSSDHDIASWWKIVQETLQKWVESLTIKAHSAVISVPLYLVKMKELALPIGLSHADIVHAIKLDMQDDFHHMSDDLAYDYAFSANHESGYATYTVALTRQSYLTPYIDCLQQSGLHLKIIDIDVLALKRLIDVAFPQLSRDLSHAFLVVYISEISASGNLLIIFKANKVIAHQRLLFSDQDDIPVILQQKIELILLAYLQLSIKQVIYCGESSLFSIIKYEKRFHEEIKLDYLNLSALFQASHISDDSFLNHPEYFLIASGLALREASLW